MAALADELKRAGAIRSTPWARAFATIPRHVFVPTWFAQETNEQGITVWRQQRATKSPEHLAAAYRDDTLVTALDPKTAEQVDDTAWTGIPTSSSTLPSLMAGMLEDLDVKSGHRVLEIGTGTGYNAALLCARLGDRLVHSVDIDPALVEAAQDRLAQLVYMPRLVVGDGRLGNPAEDKFDRIIATCSVPATDLPTAWIEQTVTGGLIVADLVLGIEGGIVRLTVDDDHRATGRFTATAGRFMAARGDAQTYPTANRAPLAPEASSRQTTLTAADFRAHYPLRLLVSAHLPGTELVYHVEDTTTSVQLQRTDGSWARIPLTGDHTSTVTYGGDPELWQRAEAAWQWWNEHGRPTHGTFGYTREADGAVALWHETSGARWAITNP
ncbi:methyltransferase domain-containing protein [Streptomyces sp. NA04227]|nr:methyltransferase domain-containing protein [Streptomyces sp. NA04227]